MLLDDFLLRVFKLFGCKFLFIEFELEQSYSSSQNRVRQNDFFRVQVRSPASNDYILVRFFLDYIPFESSLLSLHKTRFQLSLL